MPFLSLPASPRLSPPARRSGFPSGTPSAPASRATSACGVRAARLAPVRRSGFGLIELLLVMFIVAILFLLTLRIRSQWKSTAEKQACNTAMAFLRNAAKNYDKAIPVPLSDADAPGYFVDLASNGTKNRPLTPMEYFVFRASQVPQAQEQLERVPDTMMTTEQAATVQIWQGNAPGVLMKTGYVFKTVKDPWGNELKYRASSVAATETDPALPSSPQCYFASAGPDGLWGSLTNHDEAQRDDDAEDNIYMNQ